MSKSLWWGAAALMLAGLLAPILTVGVPPLTDYPNHLARCLFLAFGAQDPVLNSMFAVHWDIIPNLAVDLILPPLMHVMPPLLAGKLVVALAALLPPTGAMALSRVSFGRLSLWQLCAGFVAYNALFLLGFLNFQLAAGIALYGAAAWIATSLRRPVLAVLIGAGVALVAFIFHAFGYFFFALLIGSVELVAIVDRGIRAWRFALGRAVAVALALLLPAALILAAPLTKAGGPVVWQSTMFKLLLLATPVLAYRQYLLSALILAALSMPLAIWAARGRMCVAPLAWIAVPALLLAYAALPVGAKGGYWIDARVPVLLGFTVLATTMPRRIGRSEAMLVTVVLSALFVLRMAYLSDVWAGSRQDIADVRWVLGEVTPGSRVLMLDAVPAHPGTGGATPATRPLPASRIVAPRLPATYWHDAAFAYIDHRAYWADAFTLPGQQPVIARPPYDESAASGVPHDYRELGAYADTVTAPDATSYLAGWPAKYDYILVLNADVAPDIDTFLPQHLALLRHEGIAVLFKVVRD